MIRLATCQLCKSCSSATTVVLRINPRAFSIGKIRWRKTATSTKLVDNEDSPSISSQPLSKSTPLQPQHVQNFNNNQEQRTTTTLPITSSSSTTPLKLHNAVDPTYLKQVVAESHALDYSKLPSYYLSLSKSRLTGLVVITAMAGYAMAPASFALLPFTALTLGTALTSASANTINQIMEVEYDGQMDRTKNRVLVQRNLSERHAQAFAALTGLGGLAILTLGANPLTGILGGFNLALYTCGYTPLKRKTIANTWIGSVVGGIPPIMGWVACTGELSHGALLLGGILYAWQFPHFNALSWNIRKDYDKAGYKMMAISHPDLLKRTSLRYSLGIIAMSSLAPVCNVTSWTFVFDSLPLNGYLVWLAYKFYKDGDSASSRKLFRFTLIHLPILIVLMMISKKNYEKPCPELTVPLAVVAADLAPQIPLSISTNG